MAHTQETTQTAKVTREAMESQLERGLAKIIHTEPHTIQLIRKRIKQPIEAMKNLNWAPFSTLPRIKLAKNIHPIIP